MKHLFVPSYISLIAKEKGFDEECLRTYAYWDELEPDKIELVEIDEECQLQPSTQWFAVCAAPLYQQLIDWFEKKHNIFIEVRKLNDNKWCYQVHGPLNGDMIHVPGIENKYEAYNEAFKEAFKLIK